jgi:hypothetical protein
MRCADQGSGRPAPLGPGFSSSRRAEEQRQARAGNRGPAHPAKGWATRFSHPGKIGSAPRTGKAFGPAAQHQALHIRTTIAGWRQSGVSGARRLEIPQIPVTLAILPPSIPSVRVLRDATPLAGWIASLLGQGTEWERERGSFKQACNRLLPVTSRYWPGLVPNTTRILPPGLTPESSRRITRPTNLVALTTARGFFTLGAVRWLEPDSAARMRT